MNYLFGFSDIHAWGFGLNYARGIPDGSNHQLSFMSTHRFSQKSGLFFDFVWGYGFYWFDTSIENPNRTDWLIGADVGYNLIHTKNHWLSFAFSYEYMIGDNVAKGNKLSLNLLYTLRGYEEDD